MWPLDYNGTEVFVSQNGKKLLLAASTNNLITRRMSLWYNISATAVIAATQSRVLLSAKPRWWRRWPPAVRAPIQSSVPIGGLLVVTK